MKKIFKVLAICSISMGLMSQFAFADEGKNIFQNANVLAETEKFRSTFGLTDISSLQKSSNDYKLSEHFGVLLSSVEESELIKRLDYQEKKVPIVQNYIKENISDGDVGIIFIDQAKGGILNLGFKDLSTIEKQKDTIRNLYNSSQLNFFKIKYSEDDLNNLHKSILPILNKEVDGIVIKDLFTNVITQKLEIGVKDLNDDKRRVLEARFNPEMILVREAADASDSAERHSTFNPLQAGTFIKNQTYQSGCTIGFLTTNNMVVTAGHCGDPGDSFKQGTNDIGSVGGKFNSGNTDAASIGTNSQLTYSAYVYTSTSQGDYFSSAQSSSSDVVGEAVCFSGANTSTNPVKCGTLQGRATSFSYNGENYYSIRSISVNSIPGDSGAPTYYNKVLKGVIKGNWNGYGTYSHIGNVTSNLQVTPKFK